MSKEDFEKSGENLKDAVHEAGHEAAAKGEHLKREVDGTHMDTSEKNKIRGNRVQDKTEAAFDQAKQNIRGK